MNSQNPIKLAVLGCGQVAVNIHLPILAGFADARVVALVDPNEARRDLARRIHLQARPLASLNELWQLPDVDALLICSPTATHSALAAEAIRHGMPFYLEKPIGVNLSEAEALLAVWNLRPVLCMTGFNYRFHPLFEEARGLLAAGAVGRPLAVNTVFTSSYSVRNNWRADRGNGGGVLLDLGSHHIDLIHFLLADEVEKVHVYTSSAVSEDGTAALQMKLRSGDLVNSTFSFGTVDQDRFEILGDRALLRIDRHLSTRCEIIPADQQMLRLRQIRSALSFLRRPHGVLQRARTPGHDVSYPRALKQFIQAVRTRNSSGLPGLEDGRRVLSVLSAAEDAARQSEWMDVSCS